MGDIKTDVAIQRRDEPGRYLSTAQVVSGMQVARACLRLWYGTWEPVVSIALAGTRTDWVPGQQEGEPQGSNTSRGRVPMRGTGADRPVVAVKPGNAGRAKGTGHLGLLSGQPLMGGMSQ
jgi:hypothetical protein